MEEAEAVAAAASATSPSEVAEEVKDHEDGVDEVDTAIISPQVSAVAAAVADSAKKPSPERIGSSNSEGYLRIHCFVSVYCGRGGTDHVTTFSTLYFAHFSRLIPRRSCT